ncbi:MAG TPA: sigma-70 family RNA polymerase sigma factor [Solirubrobacteraceae bacterium]
MEWDWEHLRRVCAREAGRVLRNGSDREDAVQAALLRAWTRRTTCRAQESPDPWVAQIARREACRLATARRAEPWPDAEPAHEPRVEHAVDAILDRLHARELVGSLTNSDRQILALRYYGDMTHTQVSEALGMPVGTVKVRLHRLRHRLAAEA